MGLTLGPAFDKKFEGADSFSKLTDGKDLVQALDLLDRICNEKGVTPFGTFAPDFEALAEALDSGEQLEEMWFDCADGLHTISALIEALRTEKKWSKGLRKNEVKGLVECLQELEKDLNIAKKKKARFYLLVC